MSTVTVRQALEAAAHHSGGTARSRVIKLFKMVLQRVPTVMNVYDVDVSPKVFREAVKQQFRKNARVTDPRVVDMLVVKGYLDLEETVLQFKQKSHLTSRLGLGDGRAMGQYEFKTQAERFVGQRRRPAEDPAEAHIPDLSQALKAAEAR